MLRGLFTPLKSSFLLPSPRDPGFGEQSPVITETPEDFARDAMIQLMRYNVEAVKETKDSILQVQVRTVPRHSVSSADRYESRSCLRFIGYLPRNRPLGMYSENLTVSS